MNPLNIVVVGGGPAGLAFATLWKRRHGADRVHVVEQNAPDATFGFGVVFSDRALDFLRASDPSTHDLIAPALETWSGITVVHKGERIEIDGIGFSWSHETMDSNEAAVWVDRFYEELIDISAFLPQEGFAQRISIFQSWAFLSKALA